MAEPYPILQLAANSPETEEQLGSKDKFWFRLPGDPQLWLFKFARPETGEDWSEKIAAEIAVLLEVPAARVELAEFMGRRGSASRSFVDIQQGFELIHGSELLAGHVLGYDRAKVRQQRDHNLPNIINAIDHTFAGREVARELQVLAGFLVLDAVIGNVDRHHDNWGVLRGPGPAGNIIHQIAPSFDHASSLGRELRDERRALLLAQQRVTDYIDKGSGGIYWDASATRAESPLQLALRAAAKHPGYLQPWIQRLRGLVESDFSSIVARVPEPRMSATAKQFSRELLRLTRETLSQATS